MYSSHQNAVIGTSEILNRQLQLLILNTISTQTQQAQRRIKQLCRRLVQRIITHNKTGSVLL